VTNEEFEGLKHEARMGGGGGWGSVRKKIRAAVEEIERLRRQNDQLFLIVGCKVVDEIETLRAELAKNQRQSNEVENGEKE
jgi:hypothetical protein